MNDGEKELRCDTSGIGCFVVDDEVVGCWRNARGTCELLAAWDAMRMDLDCEKMRGKDPG